MIYGVTHVELACQDLERAVEFYSVHAQLGVLDRGQEWVDLEAGSLRVRLRLVDAPTSPAVLHLQTADVDAATVILTAAGASLEQAPTRSGERLVVAHVRDPDGHRLVLWRELGEDELDRPPALEISLPWTPEGEQAMQDLVSHVPAPFRGLARGRAVSLAESIARERGLPNVDADTAAQAYVEATPRPMRKRAYRALAAHGFDPERFRT